MSESSLRVIVLPLLVYPYFKLDIERDKIRKALLIKQETEWIEWFCSFSYYLVFWSNSQSGRLLDRGRLLDWGVSNIILTAQRGRLLDKRLYLEVGVLQGHLRQGKDFFPAFSPRPRIFLAWKCCTAFLISHLVLFLVWPLNSNSVARQFGGTTQN